MIEDMQWLALNSLHKLEDLQVCGEYLFRKHMVGQDVRKLRLVLGLQEAVQCAFRKGSKTLIGWCKHSEGSWRRQSVCQVSSNHCCDQRAQVVHRLSKLDNVGLLRSQLGSWQHDSINDVCDAIGCQIFCSSDTLEILAAGANLDL